MQDVYLGSSHSMYDVFPKGREFLILREESNRSKLDVVVNWTEELRRKFAVALTLQPTETLMRLSRFRCSCFPRSSAPPAFRTCFTSRRARYRTTIA